MFDNLVTANENIKRVMNPVRREEFDRQRLLRRSQSQTGQFKQLATRMAKVPCRHHPSLPCEEMLEEGENEEDAVFLSDDDDYLCFAEEEDGVLTAENYSQESVDESPGNGATFDLEDHLGSHEDDELADHGVNRELDRPSSSSSRQDHGSLENEN